MDRWTRNPITENKISHGTLVATYLWKISNSILDFPPKTATQGRSLLEQLPLCSKTVFYAVGVGSRLQRVVVFDFESSSSRVVVKSPRSESSSNNSGWQCILDVISSVMSPSFCPIGQDCKTLQAFLYNNVLYIRSDRKGKFWVKNSWWFKLSSQYFTERTSVIECAIVQKYLVLILLTTHLLSSSSVWSESSSSRSQNSEFESSSGYSLGGEGGSQLKSYNKVKLKYSEWYLDQRKTTQALD